jgi:hypothetical protein
MKAMKVIPVVLLLLLGTNAIAQQETPEFEIEGGFSLAHYNPATKFIQNPHTLNGGGGGVTYNLNNWLGLKAEMNQYGGTAWTLNVPAAIPTPYSGAILPAGTYHASGGLFDYLFGPQVKYHGRKLQPFVQTLFGGASSNLWTNLLKTSGISNVTSKRVSGFAMTAGGGVDLVANRRIAVRLAEFDYLMTRLNPPLLAGIAGVNNQNNWSFSTGVVLNLGSRK